MQKKKMSDVLINRIKVNLKSKFYLVNDTWLKECIEYYISENNDASLNAIEAFVISQWILSDLREINNEQSCLPSNINAREKITLPGKYILQVDKMCDISQSKYSQLQKIRNVSEVNIKATAIETAAWEPKGRRMMQLHLTDGTQDFTAVEYRPIKTLKDTLLPGFKLMIIGPVMCRKGVMMLKEENYKEIGGEVDSLLKINVLENVLARALGMEENENPYSDNNQENNIAAQNDNEFPEDEFDIDFDEITQIERLSMEIREPNFIDNRDNNQVRNITDSKNSRNNKDIPKKLDNSNKKSTINEFYEPQREMGNNYYINSQKVSRIDDEFVDEFESNIDKEIKNVSKKESKPSNYATRNINSNQSNNRGIEKIRENNRSSLKNYSQPISASSAVIPADDCFDDIDFGDELDEEMFMATEKKALAKPQKDVTKTSELQTVTAIANPEGKSTTSSGSKRPAEILSPVGCSSKIMCLQTTLQINKKNRKITEFTEKVLPKEDMPPKICEFICDVLREAVSNSQRFKTVRGKVTRIEKLIKKDKNWILKATITDQTASMEIMFASRVLEELIGFTVQEFSEKKKLRKTNPEVEEYLREGFRKAEFKVRGMDVLMDLELTPGDPLPKVVNTRTLTEEQKELIDKRMKMMAS